MDARYVRRCWQRYGCWKQRQCRLCLYTDASPRRPPASAATCHAPLQDVFTPGMLKINEVSSPAGLEGVTCQACHQIADVDPAQINGLGHISKTDYHFTEQTEGLHVFGPLPDVANEYMANVYSPLFKQALLCASCHQYNNPQQRDHRAKHFCRVVGLTVCSCRAPSSAPVRTATCQLQPHRARWRRSAV